MTVAFGGLSRSRRGLPHQSEDWFAMTVVVGGPVEVFAFTARYISARIPLPPGGRVLGAYRPGEGFGDKYILIRNQLAIYRISW